MQRPANSSPHGLDALPIYRFLIGRCMTEADLRRAIDLAGHWGVPVQEAVVASGRVTAAGYTRALADSFGLVVVGEAEACNLTLAEGADQTAPRQAVWDTPQGRYLVLDAMSIPPGEIARCVDRIVRQSGGARPMVALSYPAVLRHAVLRQGGPALVEKAVSGLVQVAPAMSARWGLWLGQSVRLAVFIGAAIGGLLVVPVAAFEALLAAFTIPFALIVFFRTMAALRLIFQPSSQRANVLGVREAKSLPCYTILVPLFREAGVVQQLVRALTALEYPAAKLDIKLVLEAVDRETQDAIAALDLPPYFDVIVVPDCQPRTKPKALNYALQFARGSYVVVYDAEDIPEPDQLLRAVDAFTNAPSGLACAQARLMIDNDGDGWLARQFAIEYASLFDGLLPTFEHLELPIPLGGTSNHFPVAILRALGGWDPYNVTEDADLGVRLARLGYRTSVLSSVTYEEAPFTMRDWFAQRTRWLKGWMQTYVVHTRRPVRLWRQLGTTGFVGFHAIVGGLILSALLHPLIYALLAVGYVHGDLWQFPANDVARVFWILAILNLGLGYLAAMLLAAVAAWQRGIGNSFLQALLIPFYWLLISAAAYRAVFQFFTAPFKWEKTRHGLTRLPRRAFS